ncbi:MAG: hypothetical protein HRS50_01565 [Mycoplasmataceae bacterium]|nr:hypothetical protein [Mycoplasmataceae bacterium]
MLMNQRKSGQKKIVDQIIINNLSVLQVEKILKNKLINFDKDYKYVEELFLNKIGFKVIVTKNKIEISYEDINQLNKILDKLGVIEE